jgi:hypothetical protein
MSMRMHEEKTMDRQLSLWTGLWLGLLLLGLSSALAQAPAKAPAQVQQPLFDRMGMINSIDVTAGNVVIDDIRYRLPQAVRVYTYDRAIKDPQALRAAPRLKDSRALREGMRIGYSVTGEGGGQRGELTEAWILPAGNIPELGIGKGARSEEVPATKAMGKTQRTQPDR